MSAINFPRSYLVTAANGDLGEAVAGTIRKAFPEATLHGTDTGESWPAMETFDTVTRVPHGNQNDYVAAIETLATELKIDLVIPCTDIELITLANAIELDLVQFPVLMPNLGLVKAFSDKLTTAEWLRNHDLPVANTQSLTDAKVGDLPLIVKPRCGSGSAGVVKVSSAELLHGMQVEYGDLWVAQEYLPNDDQEYTCALVRLSGISDGE